MFIRYERIDDRAVTTAGAIFGAEWWSAGGEQDSFGYLWGGGAEWGCRAVPSYLLSTRYPVYGVSGYPRVPHVSLP